MLPKGWTSVEFKTISTKIGSGSTPRGGRESYARTGIPLIRSMNIHFAGFKEDGLAFLDEDQARLLDGVKVEVNDILLNITGASIGRVCLVPSELAGARVNQHVCIIRAVEGVIPRYIQRFLAAPEMQRFILEENYGLTRQALTKEMIEGIKLPLPPLAEQRRIITKLDALTARLARARAELERITRLSELTRMQLITAAFDGTLTARWREIHPKSSAESDIALEKWFRCTMRSARRKPPAQIDWKPNIELPPMWRWVSIDSITAATDYGTSAKTSDEDGGVPVLRMGNLQRGEIDWTNLKYLPSQHPGLSGLLLEAGDILFNRTNSFELVGKTAIFRGHERPVSFASYLIRLRPCGMNPALLAHYLNSSHARRWVEAVASQQVGQANVNGSKLKSLGIPLPSPDEQAEMLRLLDTAFARADRLEAEAARARTLLDRLEAAILAKTFRGELVPQDPADEPASVLLERIRAQRAAAPPIKRRRSVKA